MPKELAVNPGKCIGCCTCALTCAITHARVKSFV